MFVSHAPEDADRARRLSERLRRLGFEVFLAEWRNVAGDVELHAVHRTPVRADDLAARLDGDPLPPPVARPATSACSRR